MAKRASNVALNVEQKGTTNYMRASNIGLTVEYKGTTNYMRCSTLGLMVEYMPTPIPARYYGPAVGGM